MGIINIALISPSKNAYSETFIQQHRNHLDGNIIFYFNGNIPKENDVEGNLLNNFKKIKYRLMKKFRLTKLSLEELGFRHSLKRNNIQCVVAEYGITSSHVLQVCKSLGIPLIPIFHGYDASVKSILTNYGNRYKQVFEYSNSVVVVSNKIKDTLITMGCNSNKIVVTPCAPKPTFFKIDPDFSEQRFIGVGRFVDKKAPYLTILAFKKVVDQFPMVNLIIGGDGPLWNSCKNLIKVLNLEKNIFLPGILTSNDLQELYSNSLGFVQHSVQAENGDSEGTPVAVLEASASALPVISTFHAGIPDVIINNKTGILVEELSILDMAEGMIKLLKDVKLAKEMGANGREYIKNNFSLEHHIGILNESIKKAVH